MRIGRATCDDFAVKSDCVDFFVVLSFVKRLCQLFLYFYQIGSRDPHFYVGSETIRSTELSSFK